MRMNLDPVIVVEFILEGSPYNGKVAESCHYLLQTFHMEEDTFFECPFDMADAESQKRVWRVGYEVSKRVASLECAASLHFFLSMA